MSKELVIAAYNRNYNWTTLLDASIKVTIYIKGNPARKNFPKQPEIVIDSNVGRDVHTFYYHIVNNYDTLADYTFFSQDFPFDHVANYTEIINGDVSVWNKFSKQTLNGCWFFNTWCDITDCDQEGRPNHPHLPLKLVWDRLFIRECPETIKFVPAGHFCVSRENVYSKPKSFYQEILNLLSIEPCMPWIIERLNPYIFTTND